MAKITTTSGAPTTFDINPAPPGPGEPLNVGSGGFNVDGKTFTMDVGLPGSPNGYGPYVKTIDVDKDLNDSSGRPKDISPSTRLTLASYLSDVTMAKRGSAKVPNRYPISPPDPGSAPVSTSDTAGNPTGPEPVASVNGNFFGGDVNAYSLQYPTIAPSLRKGKGGTAQGDAKDGNDLIRTGAGDDSSPLGKYQSAVLSNNRFVASTTFGASASGAAGFNPSLQRQSIKGVHDPRSPVVTEGQLASIGPLLTMRAGRELNAANDKVNPNSAALQAGALLPGFGQLGVTRIDPQVLLASDVLSRLTTDEVTDKFVLKIQDASWGQLNNTDDPFSGTDAAGMLLLSTTLVAGIEVLFDVFSVLFGLITPSLKQPTRDSQGRYSLGEYYPGSKNAKKANAGGIGGAVSALASLNFGSLLGIQPTNYPFSRALTAGMNAFFQIPDSQGGGIGLNQLVGALTSSTDSPGFNVVVARSIIRSSITIVDQLKRIGGNVMNAINQVLALIDVIRSSKLIGAVNVWANLGDAILSRPSDFVDADSAQVKVSGMDAKGDTFNAVGKNRLKGTLKLAWASNRAAANILLPNSIFAASLAVKNLGQFDSDAGLRKDPYSLIQTKVVTDGSGRIPTEEVFKIEDQLESSYVPFYFHDIRTNEVVAFHAFLTSLGDDYSAKYDASEGFGRVEPVKIYKGTERKISMAFYVVATSLLDFDEMYIKINKLVTMLYPQYTQGTTLSSGDGQWKFTQPFSQLQSASPLIRLRLGDLIRSNYSLFALGRLFGMGNKDFTLKGEQFADSNKVDQGAIDAYETAIQQMLRDPVGKRFYPDWGLSYPLVTNAGGGIGVPVPSALGGSFSGPQFAPDFDPFDSDYKGCFVIKVKQLDPDNPFFVIGEVAFNDDQLYVSNTTGIKQYVEDNFNNDDRPLMKFIGGTYRFPIAALTPTEAQIKDVASGVAALASLNPDSEFGKNLGDFLNPKNNALAKSFQDTGGKGLAGFIETMSFDWFDKVTWEIGHGRTAPKMCKVTLSFSPVHDISPGIDQFGFNRAPIYPVGAHRQGPMPYQKSE